MGRRLSYSLTLSLRFLLVYPDSRRHWWLIFWEWVSYWAQQSILFMWISLELKSVIIFILTNKAFLCNSHLSGIGNFVTDNRCYFFHLRLTPVRIGFCSGDIKVVIHSTCFAPKTFNYGFYSLRNDLLVLFLISARCESKSCIHSRFNF